MSKIWITWVLTNGVGLALIVTGGAILGFPFPSLLSWILAGGVLSFLQQRMLQGFLSPQWGRFSLAGWVLGTIAGRGLNGWQNAGWDLDWAVLGLFVGIAQWFVFKIKMQPASGWIFVSGLGFVLGGVSGGVTLLLESWFMFKGIINISRTVTEPLGFVLGALAGGAMYGAITGGWLIWFYNKREIV